MADSVSLPEPLKPISWLAGRWTTKDGHGSFPSITDFSYYETLEFKCVGQPMFNYTSISKHPEKLSPMHQESGFLRIKPGTKELALILSHNFGLTSIEEGVLDDINKEISLESTIIARISFAKGPSVTKTKRSLKLISPNTLEVTSYMETNETPMAQHLKAVYVKED